MVWDLFVYFGSEIPCSQVKQSAGVSLHTTLSLHHDSPPLLKDLSQPKGLTSSCKLIFPLPPPFSLSAEVYYVVLAEKGHPRRARGSAAY